MGQSIVILASPLLTRLYSPEDFGLLAVYAGLLGILATVASLRYQLAIPLPESDEEAAHVVVLGLVVVLGITALSTLIVGFFGGPLAEALNTPSLAPYLWLLPVGLLLTGIYQVLQYWAIRTKAFSALARTKVTQAIGMVTVQLGAYTVGPLALLLGQIAGQAAGSTSIGSLAVQRHWSVFRAVRLRGIGKAANRYRRFPIYSSWTGAFNAAGSQLPPVLLAALFNPAAAGIYVLAHRVLAMPMKLLGRAIADVFYASATDARRNDQLAPLVAGIHEKLAHIAMPPALILVLAGPQLFALVFGEGWRQAGEFAQWMAPWIYMVFITAPLSTLFSLLEKQAQGMLFQGALLSTRIVTLLIGAYYNDVMLAVALFASGSAVCWVGFLIWIIRASGSPWLALWKPTAQAFGWSILLIAPLITVHLMIEQLALWLAALTVTGALVSARYITLIRKAL